MKKIVVLGYIVRGPLGGLVFHHLQYVLGLKQLGHEVMFLEDSEDYAACYDPSRHQLTEDPTYGLHFLQQVFRRYDLQQHWAYFDRHRNQWHGQSHLTVMEFCEEADLLINLSGSNPIRPWTASIPIRIYVDTDPVFTQIHNLQKADFRERTVLHTHHFSFGENLGTEDCTVPDDGFQWRPTRQPVVPKIWPRSPIPSQGALSTVMQWDSYATLSHDGRTFGMKSASFAPYMKLPQQVDATMCLAMGSANAPLKELQTNGWQTVDAPSVTVTAGSYQDFIGKSRAEWSVAKQGYVTARSGWFSERSCAYLASGRPVIVQDTGFSKWLPTGEAVFSFQDPEESREAIDRVLKGGINLPTACRSLIIEHFHYKKVLESLVSL